MLFKSCFHEAIRRGELSSTVRIWRSARVRVGHSYRLGSGAIEVQRIQEIGFDGLTAALARRCGFASLVELLKVAKHGAGERVFLIDFRYVERPVQRESSSEVSTAQLIDKLSAMDRRAGRPWTHATLRAIAQHPGERATELAARLQRERDDFKRDVRKLKALGLTISLEVGYRLAPAGCRVVKALGDRRRS